MSELIEVKKELSELGTTQVDQAIRSIDIVQWQLLSWEVEDRRKLFVNLVADLLQNPVFLSGSKVIDQEYLVQLQAIYVSLIHVLLDKDIDEGKAKMFLKALRKNLRWLMGFGELE